MEFAFTPVDNHRLASLCGSMDANIRQIEAALDVCISRRGEKFSVTGERGKIELAAKVLNRFYARAHNDLTVEEIQLGIVEMRHARETKSTKPAELTPIEQVALQTRRADLRARTDHQSQYIRQMQTHDITFGVGPAGTGKTFLAVACAVDALERSAVQRIILTRPAVEAGERLGFLPGDLAQKVDPYLRPLYDAMYDLMGVDKVTRAFEKGTIEVAPLAFMRGRTLNHAFVILDEAQNTTPEQMKMFLTRIGYGARAVITGDVSQIDLPRGDTSGLVEAERVLRRVPGIATTHFTSTDVMRNPLVARIVEAYDAARADGV